MKALLWSMEYVLKTMHFENSHFADTVDQSEQSIVTVDQSELSIELAKCEVWTQRADFRITARSMRSPVVEVFVDHSPNFRWRDHILCESASRLFLQPH